jgi:hypothetical protein
VSAREKALVKLCKMQRLAGDDRTPDGERAAATARAEALITRYEFTTDEIAKAKLREARSEESTLARIVRERREALEAIRRQQQADLRRARAGHAIRVAAQGDVFAAAGAEFEFGSFVFSGGNKASTVYIRFN